MFSDCINQKSYKNVYIYGAGYYAKLCYQHLKSRGFEARAFVVTKKETDRYCDIPIIEANQFDEECDEDYVLVLAMSNKLQEEVLNAFSFHCQIITIRENDLLELEIEYNEEIEKIISRGKLTLIKDKKQVISKIVVIQLEMTFGDIILSSSFIRELKRGYPNAEITYVVNQKYYDLYVNNPHVDEIVGYDLSKSTWGPLDEEKISICEAFYKKTKNKLQCDAVILPRKILFNDIWENIILATMIECPIKIGHYLGMVEREALFAAKVDTIFSNLYRHDAVAHEVELYRGLLSCVSICLNNTNLEIWESEKDIIFAKKILNRALIDMNRIIMVTICGSAKLKNWPFEYYIELMRKILNFDKKTVFILTGGPDSEKEAREIEKTIGERCINLAGKTNLCEASAVADLCDIYVGADTGLMHMMAAKKKKVIEISPASETVKNFQSLSPKRFGPWNTKNRICQPKYCIAPCVDFCSEKESHCIKNVQVDDVYNAFIELINE